MTRRRLSATPWRIASLVVPGLCACLGAIWNHTTGYFQEYAPQEPTGCSTYLNTWFNEFFTPNPTNQHAVFMSDRGQPCSNLTLVPEFSDHYMCTMPGCTNIIQLTHYNTPGFPEYRPSPLTIITATRGAWSPDGKTYIAMEQYGTAAGTQFGQLISFSLGYPSTELAGSGSLQDGTLH